MLSVQSEGERAADGRRRAGDLEGAVLAVLWAAEQPMTPADVLAELDDGLAYSTVMTILVRLHRKGAIARERRGRAYAYRPMIAEVEVVTDQVRRLLHGSSNRDTVLQAFLAGLEPGDEVLLRRMLGEPNGAGA